MDGALQSDSGAATRWDSSVDGFRFDRGAVLSVLPQQSLLSNHENVDGVGGGNLSRVLSRWTHGVRR